jgi:hypothetical protein
VTTSTQIAVDDQATRWHREDGAHPAYSLIARWALISVLTGIAFYRSFYSIGLTAHQGGLGGFAWTVPTVAILVAVGVSRRHRTELPIHDRQIDIIVGTMGLVLALLIHAVLLQRYALYFHLLRLDLLAMWLFVLSSSIVLFGLRPVSRFAWVWAMMFLIFTLPYFMLVIFLGGGKFAAGAATLLNAGVGSGIAVGRTLRRGIVGSLLAWVVGFSVLTVIDLLFPNTPLWMYQEIPTVTAVAIVGLVMYLAARRGKPKRLLDRSVEPLAAKQVWAAIPLVVVVAAALALVHLPQDVSTAPIDRASPNPLLAGEPRIAPPGWATVQFQNYRDVKRLYGDDANLVRQWMTATAGDVRFDKLSRPRTVVVDSLVSHRPLSFSVYPSRVMYGLTGARFSAVRRVDLGMGVTGQMTSVVDDDLLLSWTTLQFAWGNGEVAQRISILAVDNHEPNAPFPQPSGELIGTVRTLITMLFRGNSVLDARKASFKDADLLTEFGRALVSAQFRTAGSA